MTQVIRGVRAWQAYLKETAGGASLGFVPTMGGLHEGHCSLVRRSLEENERTAVSVFLNRTQFNEASDYQHYPSDFAEDVAILQEMGVDAIFAPSYEDMYPDDYRYKVIETDRSLAMEGGQRPGHFDGVLTVVMKLLNLSSAQRAYFGEKDFQQLQLVKGMVDAFFLPIEIVACPTTRDFDGLALSSRNRRLSEAARIQSARFPEILESAPTCREACERLEEAGFKVEYVEERDGRRFGAVSLEGVRLIDNFDMQAIGALKEGGK